MRAQAIASIVSGAISAAGAVVSAWGAVGGGSRYRHEKGPNAGKVSFKKGPGKVYDGGATTAQWQAFSGAVQVFSKTTEGVGGFFQADATLKKGLKDQLKAVMEQVKSIIDRGIGTAGEERGQLQQQITQLLEQLLNLLRSYMTAKHIERG